MITVIYFKSADGIKHPKSAALEASPLSLLIKSSLAKHPDVFGKVGSVTVDLSDDGTLGSLHLSPDSLGKWEWQPVTSIPVTLAMFEVDPLPTDARRSVESFFDTYAHQHRKK